MVAFLVRRSALVDAAEGPGRCDRQGVNERGGPALGPAPTDYGGPTGDDMADRRDADAEQRDSLADRRDEFGDRRDTSGDRRGRELDRLDDLADRADHQASDRDRAASRRADLEAPSPDDLDVADQAAADRENSRRDRERAGQDRRASAAERVAAQLDRSTSSTDRTEARDDRAQSSVDRRTALTDREHAAVDREVATFDDLTGAYRRGPGLVELEREITRSARTGAALLLVFVDVDRLKAVNDAFGHAAGDALLVTVASALAARLRPYDIVVRFGGDEFICVCPGLTAPEAEDRLALVNGELGLVGRSVSVGIAERRVHEGPLSLIARADRALYKNRLARAGSHDEE